MNIELKKESHIVCKNGVVLYQIDPSRKYWFIRSDSGNYYDDFVQNDYIAIGWDYLCKDDFLIDSLGIIKNEDALKNIIDKNEPIRGTSEQGRKSTITKIFNKVARFIYEVEEGDIIITPAENSEKISIGVVTSDLIETVGYAEKYLTQNPDTELTPCPYVKRRNVHWLKHLSKYPLDIYLQRALHSQEAMTRLDDQAQYINRNLYDAYIIGDVFHGIIKSLSDEEHNLAELSDLFNNLRNTVNTAIAANNLTISPDNIKIKINAHSPIMLEMIVAGIEAAAPYFATALASGGAIAVGISQFGNYHKNKVTETEETKRKVIEVSSQENADKRKTAGDLLKLRGETSDENQLAAIDKMLNALDIENSNLELNNKKES